MQLHHIMFTKPYKTVVGAPSSPNTPSSYLGITISSHEVTPSTFLFGATGMHDVIWEELSLACVRVCVCDVCVRACRESVSAHRHRPLASYISSL